MRYSRPLEVLLLDCLLLLPVLGFLLLLSACSTPPSVRPTLPAPPSSLTKPLRPLPPVPTVQASYLPDGSSKWQQYTASAVIVMQGGKLFTKG